MTRDALRNLPVLDLSPLVAGDRAGTERLAAEVDACLQEFGFLVVVGHGVPHNLRRNARELARRFFHQDDAAKQRVHVSDRRGWVPSGYEATACAGDTVAEPDLKESFTIGQEPGDDGATYRPNRWDTGVDGFREAMART